MFNVFVCARLVRHTVDSYDYFTDVPVIFNFCGTLLFTFRIRLSCFYNTKFIHKVENIVWSRMTLLSCLYVLHVWQASSTPFHRGSLEPAHISGDVVSCAQVRAAALPGETARRTAPADTAPTTDATVSTAELAQSVAATTSKHYHCILWFIEWLSKKHKMQRQIFFTVGGIMPVWA